MKIFSKKLWSILTGVWAVLLVGVLIGTYIATTIGAAGINSFFGTKNFKTVDLEGATPQDFYTTDYGTVDGAKLLEEDRKIVEETVGEGATLLWNKEKALPLAKGSKVSGLSHSSADMVICGTGSGWVDVGSNKVNLKDALNACDVEMNPELWDFYTTGAGRNYKRTDVGDKCTEGQTWAVNEVPWNVYTDAVKNSFASYGDAAIVVLARTGGEYSDLHYNGVAADGAGNNYLALTTQEKQLLDNVKTYRENGTFKKVILLLNTGNPLQLNELKNYYSSIDACMWVGQFGSTGANAIAKLLVGDLNPSGHLPDTYAYNNESAPASVNDGDYKFSNLSPFGLEERQSEYMVYQEGIYLGYKYYETRYEDTVLGAGNASDSVGAKMSTASWDYANEVAIPFGYGDSYTDFEYSNFKASKDGDVYKVSVTVKNVGDVSGKDVVQVYLQKPYTDYDKTNTLEKSAVELAGFAKTELLEAGKSQTVTVEVPEEYFKTYDCNNKRTYILEKGTYYLTVATDAHVAVNNILDKKNYSVTSFAVMGNETVNPMGKAFVESIDIKNDDFTKYSKSTQTGYEITNQFDYGDWNKYEGKGSETLTYLSRSDWKNTYPTAVPKLSMTAKMKEDLQYNKGASAELDEELRAKYPETNGFPVYGEENGQVAISFMEIPLNKYDPKWEDGEVWEKMWNDLLDQMTWDEQAFISARAYHELQGAESIALPPTKQENGPVGITKRSDFALPNSEIKDWNYIAYCNAPLLAATWNVELVEKLGQHKSEDMLYIGYQGIYGPGVNLHRTAFGGRNFEYPSEDSFLAGKIEAAECKGIESKGCMAYAKHYALNDMETNRRHVCIWSTEQATRENYMRAFEMVFTEGGASATMNSFTRIGPIWCGASYEMMTTVLRDEWGYDGIVISDWIQSGHAGDFMSRVDGVLAGTDSFDGNLNGSEFDAYKKGGSKESPAVAWALRESSKRVIYNVVRTNIMNGMTPTTKVIKVMPWWQTALYGIDIGVGVVFAGCAAMLVVSFIVNRKSKDSAAE